jgi:hypothetical protein
MTPASLAEKLLELVAFFNSGSLDVPDGLLARDCVFRLNGMAYEESIGRPATDPLVRLVARGPAAYRFLSQRLRYLVPDAVAALDEITEPDAPGGLASAVGRLRGTPRGSASRLAITVPVALVTNARGLVSEVAIVLDPDVLARLTAGG